MTVEVAGYGNDMIKDLDIGKKILDVLEKYYALHPWFVNVSHEGGHATIQLMYEGVDKKVRIWKFGFLLHLKNIMDAQDLVKKVKNAGGEVLERYNMARGAATTHSIMDFMKSGVDSGSMVR